VPLSDHEQRILAELEESLVREDPRFADRVANETIYRHAGRTAKWAALSFLVGVAVVIAGFTQSIIFGIFGLLLMLGALVVFERSVRQVGRAGWNDLTRSLHEDEPSGTEGGIEQRVHSVRSWFSSRFHRPAED
jgi:MoaA/NifB/PqqE/SkfB family radical SAM enzyme